MIQKQFTTREAAKAVGITRATVQAWIAAKKIRAPKPTVFAGIVVRMWSKADVKMLRAVKKRIYMKGRGPKRKEPRQGAGRSNREYHEQGGTSGRYREAPETTEPTVLRVRHPA